MKNKPNTKIAFDTLLAMDLVDDEKEKTKPNNKPNTRIAFDTLLAMDLVDDE